MVIVCACAAIAAWQVFVCTYDSRKKTSESYAVYAGDSGGDVREDVSFARGVIT